MPQEKTDKQTYQDGDQL